MGCASEGWNHGCAGTHEHTQEGDLPHIRRRVVTQRLRFALDEHRPGVALDLYRLRNLDELVHRA